MTAEELVELYHKQRPKLVWEIGKNALGSIVKLHDGDSRYFMEVPQRNFDGYRLFGHPVDIVEGSDIRLITIGGIRNE